MGASYLTVRYIVAVIGIAFFLLSYGKRNSYDMALGAFVTWCALVMPL